MDRVVLFRFVQILQTGGDAVPGFIQPVEVLDLAVIGLQRVGEKLGLDPAGIHGHTADPPCLQFPVHAAAVTQDKCLGGAIGGDVRHRLPGGITGQLQDVAAGGHIGDAKPGHLHQSGTVQVDHAHILFGADPVVCTEFAAAGGVDQQTDVGLFCLQKPGDGGEAGAVTQVKGQYPHGQTDFLLKGLQRGCAACNDPDLINGHIFG